MQYSVSETTLEQIFLHFARQNEENQGGGMDELMKNQSDDDFQQQAQQRKTISAGPTCELTFSCKPRVSRSRRAALCVLSVLCAAMAPVDPRINDYLGVPEPTHARAPSKGFGLQQGQGLELQPMGGGGGGGRGSVAAGAGVGAGAAVTGGGMSGAEGASPSTTGQNAGDAQLVSVSWNGNVEEQPDAGGFIG